MSDTESVSSEGILGGRQVNSPALMNLKKPIQHAAQSMTLLKVTGYCDQTMCMVLRMFGVISPWTIWYTPVDTLQDGNEANDVSGKPMLI